MYVDLEEDKEAQFGTCQVCGASPSFVLTQHEGVHTETFLGEVEEHEDVQQVYHNAN